MFKRPHLRAAKRLVNAPSALILLFLATACSPGEEPVENQGVEPPADSVETPASDGLVLPAVWQTNDLGSPISSLGVAGELGSTVAVAYEDGGLQFLDLEGERITDKADIGVAAVADGRFLQLQGTPVTVFPGITTDGDLSLYIHGGELDEPLPYPLDAGTDELIEGLCSGAPTFERDGVMRIGFWTRGDRRELKLGRLVEIGDDLILLLDEPARANADITACVLTDTEDVAYSAPVIAATELKYRSKTYRFLLDDLGGYTMITGDNEVTSFEVLDGITVRPPARPVDMAGTGDARGGGYPGGVIVIAGLASTGAETVTYIDPSRVTLEPFGYSVSPSSD
ncbi:MAG: hypothetical protein NXH72_10810 [Hyphomonadaceae bacterium]|nr:hypothetical protein [Hyphomonadaceae bacterium]